MFAFPFAVFSCCSGWVEGGGGGGGRKNKRKIN